MLKSAVADFEANPTHLNENRVEMAINEELPPEPLSSYVLPPELNINTTATTSTQVPMRILPTDDKIISDAVLDTDEAKAQAIEFSKNMKVAAKQDPEEVTDNLISEMITIQMQIAQGNIYSISKLKLIAIRDLARIYIINGGTDDLLMFLLEKTKGKT